MLSILLILTVTANGFCKDELAVVKSRADGGILTGFNCTKYFNDYYKYERGYGPFIGYYWHNKSESRLFMQGSTIYSIKRSRANLPAYRRIETHSFEFNLNPQYKIAPNTFLYAGLGAYILMFPLEVVTELASDFGVTRFHVNDISREINAMVNIGIETKLTANTNFFFNYCIHLKRDYASNFQLGLSIPLHKREKKRTSYRKEREKHSRQQITEMKDATLLVRLKSQSKKTAALQENGFLDEALKILNEQRGINEQIVIAFKEEFTYCKVEFFYDYNSGKILKKDFQNLFLNESLKVDSSIQIESRVFIAEFDRLVPDTMKYLSHYSLKPNGGFTYSLEPNYFSASVDIDLMGLVIRDENLLQLNRPFPFFTKANICSIKKNAPSVLSFPYYLDFSSYNYTKMVRKANQNLWKYYFHPIQNQLYSF